METEKLAETVIAMRPFLPARDFALSKRFYAELGFRLEPLGADLAEMHLGPQSFVLQNYFVEAWAENFVMHMLVQDLDPWWQHIASLDLAARYPVQAPRPPKLEPWGLRTAYVFDPSGVLWHLGSLEAKRAG